MMQQRDLKKFLLLLAVMLILPFSTAQGASDGEHGSGESIEWQATDTYRVMNFVVLAAGLFFLLRKPIAQSFNSRISRIRDQLAELEEKKKTAEKELARYEEKLTALDEEAKKILDDFIQQGNEARIRIIEEANSLAERIEKESIKTIKHEFKQSKMKLQQDILNQSILKAEEIIRDKITDKDQAVLIDEYLKKVVLL
ncbi:MAG: ATP synthase F0 subunit B [Desulfobacterales bacterium]|nr:ATP synthase F0 subunit B [Desulfobacterales bacterium]